MNINHYLGPFKREIWEYQNSFFGVFIFLALLLTVLMLIAAFTGNLSSMFFDRVMIDSDIGNMQELESMIEMQLGILNISLLHVFILISGVVTAFYHLACLYDDRKDRSILFWKSLPVSETQTVITKFITGVYVVPVCALAVGFITCIVLSVILSIWLPIYTSFGVFEVWGKLNFISSFALSVVFILVTGLWVAPFCAWLMLASALSKRSPLMIAVLPPILIITVEYIFYRHSFLLEYLQLYMPDFNTSEQYDDNMSWHYISTLTKSFILGPQVLFGALVTTLLVGASIWFRNNRFEM